MVLMLVTLALQSTGLMSAHISDGQYRSELYSVWREDSRSSSIWARFDSLDSALVGKLLALLLRSFKVHGRHMISHNQAATKRPSRMVARPLCAGNFSAPRVTVDPLRSSG